MLCYANEMLANEQKRVIRAVSVTLTLKPAVNRNIWVVIGG